MKWGNLLRFDPVAVADWISCKAVGPAVQASPANADTHDAGPLERTDGRCNQRNGLWVRLLSTPAGDIELRIPKLRVGSSFPLLLDPRRRVAGIVG